MKANILDKIFKKNEYLETYDIFERGKFFNIEKLLNRNIKFTIERELGKKSVYRVKVLDWELRQAEKEYGSVDTILGTYDVWFGDGSTYSGNFVADGTILPGKVFELTSITIGSEKLRYFGL